MTRPVITADTAELDTLIARMDPEELLEVPKGKFKKAVTDLNREIVKTSPIDTGYYKSGWTLEFSLDGKSAVISNPVKYAVNLIFGTRRIAESMGVMAAAAANMGHAVKSKPYPRADLSRGILHDVRAIFFEWKERFTEEMKQR